ncbi:TPA: hypothetical protein OTP91_002239 [Enterobacter hormaechei]|uniref:hypothetical protein n=1 Tax=Enterobacter hormaechei TaxID=158836 RepID=UPI0007F8F2C2|nr:hypothetical protein [Enterobacter hormaechei]EMD6792869.1 hypothetical protein [Enterobacter hormaechei subsp. steigerwaltii]ELT0863259.1 hypothetical protein [Enterobacter hormaechei]RCG81290.1 hypothetical protein CSB66_2100 [Enterobacter hormaechei]VAL22490.1 Uncharacterised protein [Enterobacter hormaechei]HCT1842905.1 hypothetical protein [Enterobacter hormaechei]
MKYQLAKLYRGGRFFGYGIAVGGLLIDGQVSTTVKTVPNEIPKVVATFDLSNEQSEKQPRIDLDNLITSNNLHVVIRPDKPLTVEQVEELRDAVKGFIAKHGLSNGDVWKS